MERIGILGGTLDPIHRGHVEPLQEIAEELGWRRILLIPAATQPFKKAGAPASAFHRFAMAVLAVREDDRFLVLPLELERGGVSYTVETLRELRDRFADQSLDWVVGTDCLAGLSRWRDLAGIMEMANLVILRRAGHPDHLPEELQARVCAVAERNKSGSVVFTENALVEISATAIRDRIRRGENQEDLLHPEVARYIRRNGLYGAPGDTSDE